MKRMVFVFVLMVMAASAYCQEDVVTEWTKEEQAADRERWAQEAREERDKQAIVRSDRISKACPSGVGHVTELTTTNPFDNKGKCYRPFILVTMQILSRNKALFYMQGSPGRPFALIDFGKNSAPANYYSGIVKGKGAFQYTNAMGGLVTVHRFAAVQP